MMKRFLLLPLLLVLVACGNAEMDVDQLAIDEIATQESGVSSTATPAGVLATVPPSSPTSSATAIPPSATPQPPTATPLPPTATATQVREGTSTEGEQTYEVAYVASDDPLNVRAEPDPEAEIVGTLPLQTEGIEVTGAGEQVGDNLWLPIEAGELAGWVNSLYLTETIAADTFCESEEARALVEAFQEAVAVTDEEALAGLINPQRGLRVRVSWWNPEVWLSGQEVDNLLSSDTVYNWGVEDGSGNRIQGSFRDVILPMLERDLLPADEIACNEIVHGGTAGLVQLPEAYEGLNYYAFYRPPGPDQVEMDWGTWVVGVEQWQGEYEVAFLVHFAWEI